MKSGYLEHKIIKCLIIGAAGVGKTAIKHLLLDEEPPKDRKSTGVLDPIRTVSITKAYDQNGSLFDVKNDNDDMNMIADIIKSGKIPKENISVVSENHAELNWDETTQMQKNVGSSTLTPADQHTEPEGVAEVSHCEFIDAINNSKGM